MKLFSNALRPAKYHGEGKKPPFFEGWYYKNIDKDKKNTLAIIPGVFLHKKAQNSVSFIQVVDGLTSKSWYIESPMDTFRADRRKFNLRIGTSTFTGREIELDIRRKGLELKGKLTFSFLNEWPVTVTSPGIMGWYAWVPFMECFHGIISLDHSIDGIIDVNGRSIDFSSGRGYIEKDWGQAFPEAWIWQQSNHFSDEGICLTASIAIIPWIGKSFPGFIIGFLWDNRLYRFATYTGAKTRLLEISDDSIHWIVEDTSHVLEMYSKRGNTCPLQAPTPEGMNRQIAESVDSFIEVRLSQKIKTGKTVIFQGNGDCSGLEMEGNLDRLLSMVKASR